MRFMFILLLLLMFSAPALAQPATITAVESPYPQLATLTAIIASTLVVVQVLKRTLAGIKLFDMLPTWLYAVVVSNVLVYVAVAIVGTIKGDMFPLLWQGSLLAASSSGFFTWLKDPVGGTVRIKKALPLVLLCFCLIGCTGHEICETYHGSTESWLDSVNKDPDLTLEEKQLRQDNFDLQGRYLDSQ